MKWGKCGEEIYVMFMSLGTSFSMDSKKYDRIIEIIDEYSEGSEKPSIITQYFCMH